MPQNIMEEHYHNMTPAGGDLTREKLVEDLRALVHDAEELLKSGAEEAGEKARRAARPAPNLARQGQGHVPEARRARHRSAKAADRVIRSHPYESMALPLASGCCSAC